jgi:rhamnulokinase
MIKAIQDYCQNHQLKTPQTQAEFCRCIVISLAHRYKTAIDNLKSYTKSEIDTLMIIGGGSQNRLLNKMTEKIADIHVIAGEVEATAIGNIKCQLEAIT